MNSRKQAGIITITLPVWVYRALDRISFAKTRVPKGTHTDTHHHRFFSLYLVENMNSLKTDGGECMMPERALVIVLPFVKHTWSNVSGSSQDCFVSDLSPSHGEHLIYT
jgi:hypothetical protein